MSLYLMRIWAVVALVCVLVHGVLSAATEFSRVTKRLEVVWGISVRAFIFGKYQNQIYLYMCSSRVSLSLRLFSVAETRAPDRSAAPE